MGSEEVEVMKEEDVADCRCGYEIFLYLCACLFVVFLSSYSHPEAESIFSPFQSGLGYVTCYDQWDTSKCRANRSLKSPCALGLAFLAALGNRVTATS